jgi:acyl phosphate:glycerol-3-phosphate acyltransferase
MHIITVSCFIVIGYFCGSLSSAIILSKLMHLPDPRTVGSKNPGATNILRISGKMTALLVLIGDMLKGVLPVLVARILGLRGFELGIVAFCAFLGHLYPIFFGFKGGKGVATFFGTIFALSFWAGIAMIVSWMLIALIFRYSSLAALIAAILSPIYLAVFTDFGYLIPVLFMSLIILWNHRSNISRLRMGTESKIKLGGKIENCN